LGLLRVNPAGFGFVLREDGLDDVFIGNRQRELALDGDQVAISPWLGPKGTEGRVERVVKRGRTRLVGIVRKSGRNLSLEADDPRITATSGHIKLSGEAPIGMVVVATITRYRDDQEGMIEAAITRVLGEPEDLLVEIEKCIVLGEIPD